MAKKEVTGGVVSPASLWGKPLARASNKPTATEERKATRMRLGEELDSDVDAELEEDGPTEAELAVAETEDEETGGIVATSDDDEDEEDEEFEAEEGDDEDDAEVSGEDAADVGDDDVDSAVDVDATPASARTTAGATKKVKKKMAEKKSLSDYVRDEIESRQAAGDSLRGVDIVTALAKRKITVSPAQVSQLLKKAGVSQKARGGRKAVAVAAGEERSRTAHKTAKKGEQRREAPKGRATTSTVTELPWKQLNAAKAFIAACDGSFESANSTLELFHKLEALRN